MQVADPNCPTVETVVVPVVVTKPLTAATVPVPGVMIVLLAEVPMAAALTAVGDAEGAVTPPTAVVGTVERTDPPEVAPPPPPAKFAPPLGNVLTPTDVPLGVGPVFGAMFVTVPIDELAPGAVA